MKDLFVFVMLKLLSRARQYIESVGDKEVTNVQKSSLDSEYGSADV